MRRSAQNRKGFRSIKVKSLIWVKNEGGVSDMVWVTFIRVLRYSINLLRKVTKCSARRMFPGTASLSRSSGRTGFEINCSSSLACSASLSPSTSFEYSFWSLSASVLFISWIFRSRLLAPLVALRSESSVMSMLSDSMQTLSILWASSKTTIQSFESSLDTLSAILGSRR